MSASYILLEDRQPSGPHSVVVLRQKAEIRAIHPDTPIRLATPPEAPWVTIREIPELFALLFPARTTPTLGTAPSFVSTNADTDAYYAATDVRQLLRDNTARQVLAESAEPARKLAKIGARRRRDYWIVVLGSNAAAVAYIGLLAGFGTIQLVFLLGFASILTVGLYWVMFHIMDPY
jgi:hypothetical protein